jgi:uncharacterized protein (TIGR02271 family)
LQSGMVVYSADGEKLGKLVSIEGGELLVEKGFFFPKDIRLSAADVTDVRGDEIIIGDGQTSLRSRFSDAWGAEHSAQGEGDVRIPLAEEQLEVRKEERGAGEVQVRKTVETQMQTLTVPVRKESVEVERVAAPPASTEPGADAFKETTVGVPLVEEEVEIRKRPVVREEVRVRKQVQEREQRVAEEVRREDVEIEDGSETRSPIQSPDPKNPTRY